MWTFSFPEPYDAQVRAALQNGHSIAGSSPVIAQSESIRPRSYATTTTTTQFVSQESRLLSPWTSRRSLQQFSYFAVGASFVVMSALVTRRALAKKYLSIKPAGLFSPSNRVKEAPGGLDAFEALSLATLNVGSFAVMMVGGGLWAFDISNLEELRTKVRRSMDTDGKDKSEQEVEADIEEWLGVVLARLQGKNDKDISEMIKEAQQMGQSRKS
ncbi:hypothetical protein ANO11243_050600 [Dothideomycetidae sp. 11243]|nr:hypothetical protein ANO11243_050600 [fungal sp. No.11243]